MVMVPMLRRQISGSLGWRCDGLSDQQAHLCNGALFCTFAGLCLRRLQPILLAHHS